MVIGSCRIRTGSTCIALPTPLLRRKALVIRMFPISVLFPGLLFYPIYVPPPTEEPVCQTVICSSFGILVLLRVSATKLSGIVLLLV